MQWVVSEIAGDGDDFRAMVPSNAVLTQWPRPKGRQHLLYQRTWSYVVSDSIARTYYYYISALSQ